jgi:hypothetical protein
LSCNGQVATCQPLFLNPLVNVNQLALATNKAGEPITREIAMIGKQEPKTLFSLFL